MFESILTSEWYSVLAGFVAIIPRRYERSETRSIYPDAKP